MRGEKKERPTAGLHLSVGSASLPVRFLIAAIVLFVALALGAGGVLLGRGGGVGAALAILVLFPSAEIGLVAAAFIVAPHSAFGAAIDGVAARLGHPRVAAAVVVLLLTGAVFLAMAV